MDEEELREELDRYLDSEDPLSWYEVERISKLSYELGRISVYNENGLEYFNK